MVKSFIVHSIVSLQEWSMKVVILVLMKFRDRHTLIGSLQQSSTFSTAQSGQLWLPLLETYTLPRDDSIPIVDSNLEFKSCATSFWAGWSLVSCFLVAQEMKSAEVTESKLQLLSGISGAFRPGVLTALVGVSGAGYVWKLLLRILQTSVLQFHVHFHLLIFASHVVCFQR